MNLSRQLTPKELALVGAGVCAVTAGLALYRHSTVRRQNRFIARVLHVRESQVRNEAYMDLEVCRHWAEVMDDRGERIASLHFARYYASITGRFPSPKRWRTGTGPLTDDEARRIAARIVTEFEPKAEIASTKVESFRGLGGLWGAVTEVTNGPRDRHEYRVALDEDGGVRGMCVIGPRLW